MLRILLVPGLNCSASLFADQIPHLWRFGSVMIAKAACQALSQARSTDEVKAIRDKAEAIRAYARQANNKQLEVDAAELRFRAERRLGEIMTDQRTTIGMATGGERGGRPKKDGFRKNPSNGVLRLAQAGID